MSHPINFVIHCARVRARAEALYEAAQAIRTTAWDGLPRDATAENVAEGIAQFLEDLARMPEPPRLHVDDAD